MRIVRLFWAGLQVESQGVTLVIDLLENLSPVRPNMGKPHTPRVSASDVLDYALVTHLHPDHYDAVTLRRKLSPSARVLCDPAEAPKVERDGFTVLAATLYQPVTLGPFAVTALPAVDGLGDPQVSFLIEADGVKLMHFGDTLWHGFWWKIRERCGAPDIAFLPINGAFVSFPNKLPSHVPADLTPKQAASAAAVLEAKLACPMHFKAFDNPPVYVESPNVQQTFIEETRRLGVASKVLEPGDELTLV